MNDSPLLGINSVWLVKGIDAHDTAVLAVCLAESDAYSWQEQNPDECEGFASVIVSERQLYLSDATKQEISKALGTLMVDPLGML